MFKFADCGTPDVKNLASNAISKGNKQFLVVQRMSLSATRLLVHFDTLCALFAQNAVDLSTSKSTADWWVLAPKSKKIALFSAVEIGGDR